MALNAIKRRLGFPNLSSSEGIPKRTLVPEGYTPYAEVGMGHHQFRSFYIGFQPRSKALVIHEGQAGTVFLDGELTYSYEKIGRPPKAGGDTHGAMTTSRDLLFFGGWIKAPAGLTPDRRQDMREKYSHIHSLDENGRVELLWLRKWDPGLGTSEWYGEVTDLVYDEHTNSIFFTRADGFSELGLWRLDLSSGSAEYLIKGHTAYKMELKDDKLFVTEFNPALNSNSAIIVYDMLTGADARITEFASAFDAGATVSLPRQGGQIVQLQNRLLAFFRGFVLQISASKIRNIETGKLGKPSSESQLSSEDFVAYPFFEAFSPEDGMPYHVGGLRGQKVYINGIPFLALVPWDHLSEVLSRTDEAFLLRVDGAVPQIVATAGSVSGIATDGQSVYIGASYANHTGVYTYRAGAGGVFELPVKEVFSKPWTPVRMWLWDGEYEPGKSGVKGWFGGIPVKGFWRKRLKVRASEPVKLAVREFTFLPGAQTDEEVQLNEGWNAVDLSDYYDMVAFSLSSRVKLEAELAMDPRATQRSRKGDRSVVLQGFAQGCFHESFI